MFVQDWEEVRWGLKGSGINCPPGAQLVQGEISGHYCNTDFTVILVDTIVSLTILLLYFKIKFLSQLADELLRSVE